MESVRKRLTYANVMSSIAVFLVLGGATAFAASTLGKNTVGAKQLKANAVTAAKIKNGAVNAAKIAPGAVGAGQINTSGLTVPTATKALTADKATSADKATNADHATTADSAKTANSATTANTANTATTANSATTANGVSGEFFAVVRADGTLVRGTPGVTSQNEGGGTARVIIGTPTAGCFTVATLGGSSPGSSNVGQISVNPSSTNLNSFWIVTANPTGTTTAEPFTLYARC